MVPPCITSYNQLGVINLRAATALRQPVDFQIIVPTLFFHAQAQKTESQPLPAPKQPPTELAQRTASGDSHSVCPEFVRQRVRITHRGHRHSHVPAAQHSVIDPIHIRASFHFPTYAIGRIASVRQNVNAYSAERKICT